jgi:hypothetical protein
LLLEAGASYTNLVDTPPIPPTNPTAAGLGWNRVTPGDPSTSYLFHKITGDLNDDPLLGGRMPLGGKKLNGTLREIVELWTQDGAPETGWVNGTY